MSFSSFLQRNHKPIFYLLWISLSLVQAAGTGLLDDEAYYWVYSKYPDWGYFDHPPMIAILIRAGYNLFQNELGVRLFIVILSTLTVRAIDLLLENRNDRLFYMITLSMFLLQIGSMIAVPDVPLLFFTALYFLAYRRFIGNYSVWNALLLGATIAGMFYSKYHGVLIVIFTLLSNLSLVKKPQAWLAVLFAFILFLPHLWWQYTHDFISVQYHLFERNATKYQSSFTTEYIFGQILLAGPLIGWLLLWSAGKFRARNKTEKALQWCFFGVYGLFLISTFKGRTEANWTVPAYISLIVLAHQYLHTQVVLAKWIYRLFIPSFMLVLVVRVYMLLDIAPLPFLKKDEFHKTREWAQAIQEKAGNKPVAFINSYQRASQYWFYSGQPAFSVNNVYYRRSNYNFWPLEAPLINKPVLVVSPIHFNLFPDSIPNSKTATWSLTTDPYFSHSQIRIAGDKNIKAKPEHLHTKLEFSIPDGLSLSEYFNRFDTAKIVLTIYFHDNDPGLMLQSPLSLREALDGKTTVDMALPASLTKGRYRARWAINSCLRGLPTLNSNSYMLDIE